MSEEGLNLPTWLRRAIELRAFVDWPPPPVSKMVSSVLLDTVALCEADLRQRGDGALWGEVDCPSWDLLVSIAQIYKPTKIRSAPDFWDLFRDEWQVADRHRVAFGPTVPGLSDG